MDVVSAVWVARNPVVLFEVVVNESQTPVCPNLAAVLIISARLKGSCQLACTKTNQPRNKQNKKVRQTHSTCSTVSQCGCGCGMSTKNFEKKPKTKQLRSVDRQLVVILLSMRILLKAALNSRSCRGQSRGTDRGATVLLWCRFPFRRQDRCLTCC